ncbi:hypothetical protein BX257_4074 [Streptomyces sp. 3212.3]|uniref:hypothetical protein n=1 Tax=Streptomyces sp. 3212.3 TaxID=1938846 RepID=UPI000E3626E0|nr:hypothetical protein [Streptomyces sp. 3212.3]REE61494.1 hypothetical protein BX257_4074 [Streptomyces sp. 3212.3]
MNTDRPVESGDAGASESEGDSSEQDRNDYGAGPEDSTSRAERGGLDRPSIDVRNIAGGGSGGGRGVSAGDMGRAQMAGATKTWERKLKTRLD